MTDEKCQIAQLQDICRRTLEILEEEGFFDKTTDEDGFWHSSLARDLEKAAGGKELKLFRELMRLIPDEHKSI